MGIVGALLAGMFLSPLPGVPPIHQNNFNYPALLVSVLGSLTLLTSANVFRGGAVR